jgi:transcriptional regulator with XRE-family HTH domain
MTAATPGGQRPETTEAAPQGRRPADIFSNRLLLAIRLTGLSIRDFADQAGLDDGSVSNWTRGMRPRDFPEVCRAIAEAHDIDLMWLMQGGALLPARGLQTKRVSEPTGPKELVAAWFASTRPNGGPATGESSRPTRRTRLLDRTLPLAA